MKARISSNFGKFALELRPLINVRIEFLLNIFCIYLFIDQIYVGNINHCFSQICKRVMALNSCQNLFFTQYLENESTKWDQILYIHYHWQDLHWWYKPLFFCKFATELRPLIGVRFWFLLNVLRTNWQNETKFCIHIFIDKIYVGIVTRCLLQICYRVTTLDRRKELVFAQYLKNEWTEFNLIYNALSLTKSTLWL